MSAKTLNSTEKISSILIIEEVEDEARNLADVLAADYYISVAPNISEAAKRLAKDSFRAIIFDLLSDGSNLVDNLQTLQQLSPDTPVIVIGLQNDAQLIVNAVKAGAFDFVTRPYPPEKIKLSVQQALENRNLKNEIDYLRREQDRSRAEKLANRVSTCVTNGFTWPTQLLQMNYATTEAARLSR